MDAIENQAAKLKATNLRALLLLLYKLLYVGGDVRNFTWWIRQPEFDCLTNVHNKSQNFETAVYPCAKCEDIIHVTGPTFRAPSRAECC